MTNYYDKHKRDPEARAFYKSKEWTECRALVLKRDHGVCQDCLAQRKITKAKTVHHIKELRDHPELSLTLDNLVSLCNACHNRRHPEKGAGPTAKAKPKRRLNVVKTKANPEL
ncbi:HNH endonuclease signature motif containing protein [Bacillus atrophaeus]|uniref:HNH endonuclease n=1 Tax=Bacillus atrophaeus TaxID=1452 RepID=UPI002E20F7A4|nr:HNH endonuclease signature motif containing protein [Bacillus atrophaeus]